MRAAAPPTCVCVRVCCVLLFICHFFMCVCVCVCLSRSRNAANSEPGNASCGPNWLPRLLAIHFMPISISYASACLCLFRPLSPSLTLSPALGNPCQHSDMRVRAKSLHIYFKTHPKTLKQLQMQTRYMHKYALTQTYIHIYIIYIILYHIAYMPHN